jgi:hypothetical protein
VIAAVTKVAHRYARTVVHASGWSENEEVRKAA